MTTQFTEIPEKSIISGERRLLVAILRRAALDYLGESSEHVSEAESWIYSESDETKEYSFRWICEMLSLDMQQLRAGLRALRLSGKRDILKSQLEGAFV